MNKTTRIIALVLVLLMVCSVFLVAITAKVSAADTATISYSFANSTAGDAQGTITLTPETDAKGNCYIYWADDTKVLDGYDPIGVADLSKGTSVEMPAHTAIPADATAVAAFKATTEPNTDTTTLLCEDAYAIYPIPESKQLEFASEDALYTFGAISDPQIANDSYGSNSYPFDEQHLKAAFETLNARDVDFTVSSGDTVNDQDGNRTFAAEYKVYQKILADSSYAKPIYEAIGNHDVGTVWNKTGNYYNNNAPFIKATGLDSTAETINKAKPYFEVTEPKTGDHFIFMALEGGFYTDRGTQFSTAQLDWLEGLLKKYSNDGKNIFIIEHANVQGWGSGDKLTTPYYYDLGLNPANADVARFVKLMETYKDCVIITGHTHLELSAQYNYSDNNGTSAVMMHNSAVGGVRRLVNGTIDRSEVSGLSEGYIVEVYNDCVIFNGINLSQNDIMPKCSYIIRFDDDNTPAPEGSTEATQVTTTSSASADTTEATTADPVETTTSADVQNITITLKSSSSDTDWVLNSDSRVVTLIDNATGTQYTATLTAAGWEVTVPDYVVDITFHRVKNGTVSHTWLAGNRVSDVNYFITGDARGHWENEVVPEYADVYLPGSFNSWDQTDAFEKTTDANVVTRTLSLAAGTYTFKVKEGSAWLGNGGTINNTTTTTSSGGWMMSASDGDCTLIATGGLYTFNFNTSTNKLIVIYTADSAKAAVAAVGADGYIYGDANIDGTVNIKDATVIQKFAADLETLEGVALKQADVTADGSVNIKDATSIQKFVADLIDKFPADEVADTTPTEPTTPDKNDELAEKYLAAYYTYSSYNQYQALKYATKVSKDFDAVPELISNLEGIVTATGSNLIDPDAPEATGITVYFSNNYNWSNVNAYIWGSAGTKATWPGEAMTYVGTNNMNEKIYSITLDYEEYQNIIFNDGSKQTVDITLSNKNNVGYYISGESAGKYTCTSYDYAG